MTTDTEALRAKFERRMNQRGWSEANLRRDGLDYSSTLITEAWHAYQAGHAAAKAETAAPVVAALIEAEAGLEFAAAQLPQTTGFVPAHVAALQIVRAALSTAAAQPPAIDADALAQHIRKVDGKHDMGSGALAESIVEWLAAQPTAQQGEPFGYFRAEPFGWTDCAEGDEGAVALYERPGVTDATLHKIINDVVEDALDAAGAPAGTLVERIGALAEDARRLDWLTFNIGGKALRDIGVLWSEHGDARRAIDAARTQQEER